jgi:hypothetical protein
MCAQIKHRQQSTNGCNASLSATAGALLVLHDATLCCQCFHYHTFVGAQEVQHVLKDNAANKAAGRALLAQLPPQRRMAARLRSLIAIAVIYSTFWVSFPYACTGLESAHAPFAASPSHISCLVLQVSAYAAAALTALWWLISRFLGNGSSSSGASFGMLQGTAAATATAAALPMQPFPAAAGAGRKQPGHTSTAPTSSSTLAPSSGDTATKTAIVTGENHNCPFACITHSRQHHCADKQGSRTACGLSCAGGARGRGPTVRLLMHVSRCLHAAPPGKTPVPVG